MVCSKASFLLALSACLWQTVAAVPLARPQRFGFPGRPRAAEPALLEQRSLTDILQNIECSNSASTVVADLASAIGVLDSMNGTVSDTNTTSNLASIRTFLVNAQIVGNAIVGACNLTDTQSASAANATSSVIASASGSAVISATPGASLPVIALPTGLTNATASGSASPASITASALGSGLASASASGSATGTAAVASVTNAPPSPADIASGADARQPAGNGAGSASVTASVNTSGTPAASGSALASGVAPVASAQPDDGEIDTTADDFVPNGGAPASAPAPTPAASSAPSANASSGLKATQAPTPTQSQGRVQGKASASKAASSASAASATATEEVDTTADNFKI